MDPERLQTLSQIVAFIGVLATGLGSLGAYYYGNEVQDKKDNLTAIKEKRLEEKIEKSSKTLDRVEEIALRTFPNSPKQDAVNMLIERLDNTDKEVALTKDRQAKIANDLAIDKRVIRSFGAKLKIKYIVQWNTEPEVGTSTFFNCATYLYFKDQQNKYPQIDFCTFNQTVSKLSLNTYLLQVDLQVQPHSPIMGYSIEDILQYDQMVYELPLGSIDNLATNEVIIEKTEGYFIINSQRKGEGFHLDGPINLDPRNFISQDGKTINIATQYTTAPGVLMKELKLFP